jgi:hypothetical protein
MNIQIAPNDIPLLWKGGLYQIGDAGIESDQPYATVNPFCQELVDVLCAKLIADRSLIFYFGAGFKYFLEDME